MEIDLRESEQGTKGGTSLHHFRRKKKKIDIHIFSNFKLKPYTYINTAHSRIHFIHRTKKYTRTHHTAALDV